MQHLQNNPHTPQNSVTPSHTPHLSILQPPPRSCCAPCQAPPTKIRRLPIGSQNPSPHPLLQDSRSVRTVPVLFRTLLGKSTSTRHHHPDITHSSDDTRIQPTKSSRPQELLTHLSLVRLPNTPTHRRYPNHLLAVHCSPSSPRPTFQLPHHSSIACEPYLSFSGLSQESSPRPAYTINK
ncbi:unnamed protein product [Larinioides sclopetarius]|uniref:Uncharacterized protein n=1 Tax=Larinioides sclopetarius TaxID=280406 RepID=A0AAV2B6K7_9ARAC